MPVLYPDNIPRGDRCKHIINDIVNIQLQIANASTIIESCNTNMGEALKTIMSQEDVDNVEELEKKIIEELPEDQREQYKKLIEFNEQFGDTTDNIRYIVGVVGKASKFGGLATDIATISQSCGMMQVVRQYAKGFQILITEGFDTAFAYMRGVRSAMKIISDDFTEVTRMGKILGAGAQFVEFLGYAGVVVESIILVMQAIEGAIEKKKLIEAIHQTQVARLSSANFSDQATYITSHIQELSDWADMAVDPDPDSQAAAKIVASKIAKRLAASDSVSGGTSVADTEKRLYAEDHKIKQYFDDDYSEAEVVQRALVDIKGEN